MKKRCLICLEILTKEDEFTYSCDGDEETLASPGWKRDTRAAGVVARFDKKPECEKTYWAGPPGLFLAGVWAAEAQDDNYQYLVTELLRTRRR
jgi:hypothetical protein